MVCIYKTRPKTTFLINSLRELVLPCSPRGAVSSGSGEGAGTRCSWGRPYPEGKWSCSWVNPPTWAAPGQRYNQFLSSHSAHPSTCVFFFLSGKMSPYQKRCFLQSQEIFKRQLLGNHQQRKKVVKKTQTPTRCLTFTHNTPTTSNIKSCQGTSPRDKHKYIFAIIILQMNMQIFKNLFILFN